MAQGAYPQGQGQDGSASIRTVSSGLLWPGEPSRGKIHSSTPLRKSRSEVHPPTPPHSSAECPETHIRPLGRLHRHLGGLIKLLQQTLEFLRTPPELALLDRHTASNSGHQHPTSAGSFTTRRMIALLRPDVLT